MFYMKVNYNISILIIISIIIILCYKPYLAYANYEDISHFHTKASKNIIYKYDVFNVSCWADNIQSIKNLCDSLDNLYMQRKDKLNGKTNWTKLETHQLNSTAIYYEETPKYTNTIAINEYRCMCQPINQSHLAINHANIPIHPRLEIKDFKCHFIDEPLPNAMLCQFTEPPGIKNLSFPVNFTITHSHITYKCSNMARNPSQWICNITTFCKTLMVPDLYEFQLKMLDGAEQIQHFTRTRAECIIMEKPEWNDIYISNITTNSICFNWTVQRQYQAVDIQFDAKLQPDFIKNYTINTSRLPKTQVFCVHNLPYPYYNYTIWVRQRHTWSNGNWSEYANMKFTTASMKPNRPPKVWPGAYHRSPTDPNELHVYWQQLNLLEHNGPDFSYNVIVNYTYSTNEVKNANITSYQNKAIIRNLDIENNRYMIIIKSQNINGTSANSSYIVLPPFEKTKDHVPLNLHLFKKDTLKWNPPKRTENLESYTLYWCTTSSRECVDTEQINSIVLNATQETYQHINVKNESYDWAISANYGGSLGPGGMIWVANVLNNDNDTSSIEQSIEGVVALLILGFSFYALYKKIMECSDLEIEIPPGVEKDLMSQIVLEPNDSLNSKIDEIPKVMHGNIRPLNVQLNTFHVANGILNDNDPDRPVLYSKLVTQKSDSKVEETNCTSQYLTMIPTNYMKIQPDIHKQNISDYVMPPIGNK